MDLVTSLNEETLNYDVPKCALVISQKTRKSDITESNR